MSSLHHKLFPTFSSACVLLILPSLLVAITGWGNMYGSYTWLHKGEWGYLVASAFSVAALFLILKNAVVQRNLYYSLCLFIVTALALSWDVWLFDQDVLPLMYWGLIYAVSIVIILDNAITNRAGLINTGAIVSVAFLALVCEVFIEFIFEISTYQPHYEWIQLSEFLSEEFREGLLTLVDPIFFLGLGALIIAAFLGVSNLARSKLSLLRNLGVYPWLVVFVALPSTYLVNALGEIEVMVLGFSFYEVKFLARLMIILFVLLTLIPLNDFKRINSPREMAYVYLGLLIAIHFTLTPIMSSSLGNLQQTMMCSTSLLLILFLTFNVLSAQRINPLAFSLGFMGLFFAVLSYTCWEVGTYDDGDGQNLIQGAFTWGRSIKDEMLWCGVLCSSVAALIEFFTFSFSKRIVPATT